MHKIIVVNSTPLISLGNIDALWILKDLYNEIVIPEAVFNEVQKKSDSAAALIFSESWIKVQAITEIKERKMYLAKLHAGEVEVMILAQEINADFVIIDDNAAKKTAQFLGINVVGTMGILLKAKECGLISHVRTYIDKLIENDFYISPVVVDMVLELAGEL